LNDLQGWVLILDIWIIKMNYPAARLPVRCTQTGSGVSTVIPAPNQVRGKLQPESRNMLDWIPDRVRDDKTKQASGNYTRRD